MISFLPDTPEYRIEFFQQDRALGLLRIKGPRLDAPAEESWDFHPPAVDQEFVGLVEREVSRGR